MFAAVLYFGFSSNAVSTCPERGKFLDLDSSRSHSTVATALDRPVPISMLTSCFWCCASCITLSEAMISICT